MQPGRAFAFTFHLTPYPLPMYYDDFDHYPSFPSRAPLPARPRWPRTLGLVLLSLLAMLHACA